METPPEPAFPDAGFADPKVETWRRYDVPEVAIQVSFRNGICARRSYPPESARDRVAVMLQLKADVDGFRDMAERCAREDRDW